MSSSGDMDAAILTRYEDLANAHLDLYRHTELVRSAFQCQRDTAASLCDIEARQSATEIRQDRKEAELKLRETKLALESRNLKRKYEEVASAPSSSVPFEDPLPDAVPALSARQCKRLRAKANKREPPPPPVPVIGLNQKERRFLERRDRLLAVRDRVLAEGGEWTPNPKWGL